MRAVIRSLSIGLSAGLFALVLLLAALVLAVPLLTGSTPMTVLTGSMEPVYPEGTLIIVRPIDAADIGVGDPITFQLHSGEPTVVTHRVVAVRQSTTGGRSFVVKGDNNRAPDAEPVLPIQVRGVVWYSVPLLGYLNTLVNGENRPWIVPVVAFGLIGYAGYQCATAVPAMIARHRSRRRFDASSVGGPSFRGQDGDARPAEPGSVPAG